MGLIRLLHFRQTGLLSTLITLLCIFALGRLTAAGPMTPAPVQSIQSLISQFKRLGFPRGTPDLSEKEIKEIKQMQALQLHSYFTKAKTTEHKIAFLPTHEPSLSFQTTWPWSGEGEPVHAIAKAMTSKSQFLSELQWFNRVGHLVDFGVQVRPDFRTPDPWWIIVNDVTDGGKRRPLARILGSHPTMTLERCEGLVNKAVELTLKKISWYVKEHQTLNTQACATNVLFTYEPHTLDLQAVEFEDWSRWEEQIDDRPEVVKGEGERKSNNPKVVRGKGRASTGTKSMDEDDRLAYMRVWQIQQMVKARFKTDIKCTDYVQKR